MGIAQHPAKRSFHCSYRKAKPLFVCGEMIPCSAPPTLNHTVPYLGADFSDAGSGSRSSRVQPVVTVTSAGAVGFVKGTAPRRRKVSSSAAQREVPAQTERAQNRQVSDCNVQLG